MDKQEIKVALGRLIETLAAIEHERWSHWQRHMHSCGLRQPDGSLLLPADLVQRWERQMATAYCDLSEAEKESDREQVQRYIEVLVSVLEHPTEPTFQDLQ